MDAENVTPDHIQRLVGDSARVIAWAAAEAERSGQRDAVVMLVDLGGAEEGDRKVIDFFNARVFGNVAACAITLSHARGLIKAAVAYSPALLARLDEAPPTGFVHTLVLSRSMGRVALILASRGPRLIFQA